MNNFNVIGDIAGNYKTMIALIEKMPSDAQVLSLGDPNDRGPRSKEVIEYLMEHGKLVNSNHAHMMVEAWKQEAMPGAYPEYYDIGIWPYSNGGMNTVFSYASSSDYTGKLTDIIPEKHIRFLEQCPFFIESEDFIFTHAPIHVTLSAEEATDLGHGFAVPFYDQTSENSIIWNRIVPHRVNPKLHGKINIFGHNASNKPKVYTTEFCGGIKVDQEKLNELLSKKGEYPIYAIALDTSHGTGLTGLHLPTMTLYQQEFID